MEKQEVSETILHATETIESFIRFGVLCSHKHFSSFSLAYTPLPMVYEAGDDDYMATVTHS